MDILILIPLLFVSALVFILYRLIKNISMMRQDLNELSTSEKDIIKKDLKKSFREGLTVLIRHIVLFK